METRKLMFRPAPLALAVALSFAGVAGPAAGQNAAPTNIFAPATPAKPPVPDAAALKEATKLVDGVYKDEAAAARTPEARRALAQKWLKAAAETQNDPAGRYVLLTR